MPQVPLGPVPPVSEELRSRMGAITKTIARAADCPNCRHRMLHGGCPLDVFDFDQGRYMCDVYLAGFTD